MKFNDFRISPFLHLFRVHGAHEFRIYRSNNDISCHAQFDAERSILVVSLGVPGINFIITIYEKKMEAK